MEERNSLVFGVKNTQIASPYKDAKRKNFNG